MPTYEYECKSCGHGFEIFQSMSDPPLKDCPECGKEIRRLIFGGTGVIFKGSGFYVTDKKNSSVMTAGKDTSNKPEAKTSSTDNTSKESSAGSESSKEHNSKDRDSKYSAGVESSHSESSVRTPGGNKEKPELKSKSA